MARIGVVNGDSTTLKNAVGTATRDAPIVFMPCVITGPVATINALSRTAHSLIFSSILVQPPLLSDLTCGHTFVILNDSRIASESHFKSPAGIMCPRS